MTAEPIKRRDVLKPWFLFNSEFTGKRVSRLFALMHPYHTVKERRS
ncbi:MAG: hypothetical protein NUV75_00630 [Gallionella sp.]|nr:hypothetical protein [Gallionella sp.]